MAQLQELAAKGGDCGFCGDGHGCVILISAGLLWQSVELQDGSGMTRWSGWFL
jgi:hypothetical protein